MEPISAIVLSLALGAAAIGKEAVSSAVKDAYAAVKDLIKKRYPKVPIEQLEQAPESTARWAVVENDLAASGAGQDAELVAKARTLVELVQQHALAAVASHAIDLKAFTAGGLRVQSVTVSGHRSIAVQIAGNSIDFDFDIKRGAEYVVWYGTNRRPIDPADAGKSYSAERGTTVHHGSCCVFIPESHKIGSTGSPWWKRLFTGDDRLKLRAVTALGTEDYWRGVAAQLGAADPGERHALVFIHGYNVSFEQAALRAAQIGFDLQVRGAMAFFSWPSRGRLDGYLADAATIDASEGAITDFLVDFADRSGASAVHIIAHSMGNRGVLRAVDRIAQRARRRSKKKRFGQVILAAADVDADLFRQRCAAYVQLAQRTTLYVSTRDLAVEASHWLHGFQRAGLMPPVLVVPGIDTVNVENVDLTRLGHGYIAEARGVLQDMHDLIARGAPPEQRFGLRAADSPDGGRYWVVGA